MYELNRKQKIYYCVKVFFDFIIALMALIVLAPFFLIIVVAIRLDSKGPAFFVQKRIGRNGKLFRCIKFRTMSLEANHNVAGYEYEAVSAYITRVGAFLRKFSIDELPQLFNILAFQMSLIGFRPSQPCEKDLNDAREAHDLYQIKPGLSGWAQVNGRDMLAAHPKEKAEFDAYYLQNYSFWLDVKIFLMTFAVILKTDEVIEGVIDESVQSPDCDLPEENNCEISTLRQEELV